MADNGGADIIVHVAGGGASAPSGGFATLTPELWHRTLQLNLLGAVRVDRGLIPAMIQTGVGSIVHVTSIQRKMPLYDATLRLRGGQGRTYDLQQRPGQRTRTARHSRQHCLTRLHPKPRSRTTDRNGQPRASPRPRRGTAKDHGLTRRDPGRLTRAPRRHRRTRRLPGLRPRLSNNRRRTHYRRRNDPNHLSPAKKPRQHVWRRGSPAPPTASATAEPGCAPECAGSATLVGFLMLSICDAADWPPGVHVVTACAAAPEGTAAPTHEGVSGRC
jgi:NAD(P)-dependent dehydrogenase (short-subunit alcohol dehydrogenase family)